MTRPNVASLVAEIEARSTERHLREWGEQFAAFGSALITNPEQIMIPGLRAPGAEHRLMFFWKGLSPISAWPIGRGLIEYAQMATMIVNSDIRAAQRDATGVTANHRGDIIKRFGILKLSLAQEGRRLVEFGGALARAPGRCALSGQNRKAEDAVVFEMADILPVNELLPLFERRP